MNTMEPASAQSVLEVHVRKVKPLAQNPAVVSTLPS